MFIYSKLDPAFVREGSSVVSKGHFLTQDTTMARTCRRALTSFYLKVSILLFLSPVSLIKPMREHQ